MYRKRVAAGGSAIGLSEPCGRCFLAAVGLLSLAGILVLLASHGWLGIVVRSRCEVIRSDVVYHLLEWTCRWPSADPQGGVLLFARPSVTQRDLDPQSGCWQRSFTVDHLAGSFLVFSAELSGGGSSPTAMRQCSPASEFCESLLFTHVSELQLRFLDASDSPLGPVLASLSASSTPVLRILSTFVPATASSVVLRACAYSRVSSDSSEPSLTEYPLASALNLWRTTPDTPQAALPAPLLRKAPLLTRCRALSDATEYTLAWETTAVYPVSGSDGQAYALMWKADTSNSITSLVPHEQWELLQVAPCHCLYRARIRVPSGFPHPRLQLWLSPHPDRYHIDLLPSGNMLVVSDSQYGAPIFRRLLRAAGRLLPRDRLDYVMNLGDFVDRASRLDEWDRYFWKPLELLHPALVPSVFVRGNHDSEHPLSYAYTSAALLSRPEGGHMDDRDHWHTLDLGAARVFVLNSNLHPLAVPRQLEWLETALQEAVCDPSRLWLVAALHIPPFTDLWERPGINGEKHIRQFFVPLFERYGVSLVLSGHTHAFLRGFSNGIHYVIVGGAGGNLDVDRHFNWGIFSQILSTHHLAHLSTDPTELSLLVFDQDSLVLDSLTLSAPSPALLHHRATIFSCHR